MSNAKAEVVRFHDQELLLIDCDGQPHVPMRPVVDGMGMAWQTQHRKLMSGRFSATVTEMVIVAADGKQRPMTCLPLRKLPGWLMSIHPAKVRPEIRPTVIAYQDECDDVLWQHWNERHASAASTGDAARIREATKLAALISATVHLKVFDVLCQRGTAGLMTERYMLTFDGAMTPKITSIEPHALVLTLDKLIRSIGCPNDIVASDAQLVALVYNAADRLHARVRHGSATMLAIPAARAQA